MGGATPRGRVRSGSRLLTLLVCTVVLLMLPAAALATHPSAEMRLRHRASLLTGALLKARVVLTCYPLDAPEYPELEVYIRQAVGSQIAYGSGSLYGTTITCDGVEHLYRVYVWASTEGPPFQVGTAVGTAYFDLCGSHQGHYGCEFGSNGPKLVELFDPYAT